MRGAWGVGENRGSMTTEPLSRVLVGKAEQRAFYDKIAPVYDLLSERAERPMRQEGLGLLAPAPDERLLEVGPATGHCLVALAEAVGPGGRVVGVDLAPRMCRIARERVEEHGMAGRVLVCCADAEALPLAEEACDGVFMAFTLELFDTPDIPRVLAECRRVLRPGGRLVVVSVSKAGGEDFSVRAFEWTHRHFPNLVDCRPILAAAALEAAGFEVERAELRRMWVPVEIVRGRRG